MTRGDVNGVIALTEPLFARFGFEYQVTFSSVTARALCAVMSISYNKADAAEAERARVCYQSLLDALMAAGYVPYRMGNLGTDQLSTGSEVFWDVTADLKAALDPQGVFSPGHYEPAVIQTGQPLPIAAPLSVGWATTTCPAVGGCPGRADKHGTGPGVGQPRPHLPLLEEQAVAAAGSGPRGLAGRPGGNRIDR
jgi:hypothetical protein